MLQTCTKPALYFGGFKLPTTMYSNETPKLKHYGPNYTRKFIILLFINFWDGSVVNNTDCGIISG